MFKVKNKKRHKKFCNVLISGYCHSGLDQESNKFVKI